FSFNNFYCPFGKFIAAAFRLWFLVFGKGYRVILRQCKWFVMILRMSIVMMIARRYLSVVLVLLLALNGCVVPGKMP
ncbi:MAG TPA: hypothetical protein DCS88_05260, partial [Alphaproteobacteria bacterium]|nr:hypothetical protein [Alphaproteobacteria bacterium]